MHYAICWNLLLLIIVTIYVSVICPITHYSENTVIRMKSAGNQRRYKSSLVETSETLRVESTNNKFNEWLAGLIDGHGSLQVSKKAYTSLEITMGIEDLYCLRYIQDKLGGTIKLRSGAKAYRYRLHNKSGMIKLINMINGNIRNSARMAQLHKVCQVLEISIIKPLKPLFHNSWFAGLFDSDGTITLSLKNNIPQLSIRVTSKLFVNIEPFTDVLKGNIYFDSSTYGIYVWSIQSKKDVLNFLDYFNAKSSIFKSRKSKKLTLIKQYYELCNLQAYKSDSIHHKLWIIFLDKWNFVD